MNLYFSGSTQKGLECDTRIPRGPRHRLASCHQEYLRAAIEIADVYADLDDHVELMFDSGAFTAWSRGHEVVLDDLMRIYDDMLDRYWDKVDEIWLISLDKIPGSPGRTAGPAEIDEAVRISDENYAILEARYGERVLPVFHQNESTERLHEVAAMAPYVCVSPRNDLHETARVKWAAEVHARIPGVKTHGLAATGYSMMSTIPWGSVDSASWIFCAANGAIIMNEKLRILQISDQSLAQKTKDQHYNTLPTILRARFEDIVESKGFSVATLMNDFKERLLWNLVMLTEVRNNINIAGINTPTNTGLFEL